MERKYDPIGVFDSGVGGISVLRELMRQMPHESFVYYGDSANAPYGARTPEEVCALTEAHVQQLIDRGAKAIVIACNTATGAAIRFLREKYTQIPIIGMEPAIKPAVQAYPGGRILVMATPVTLSSPGFRRLMEAHADQAEILPAPCSQLARMIESGRLDGEELEEYLRAELADFLKAPPEAVVLGCTHFSLLAREIAAHFPSAHMLDAASLGAAATAARVPTDGEGTLRFVTTDAPDRFSLCASRVLSRPVRAELILS